MQALEGWKIFIIPNLEMKIAKDQGNRASLNMLVTVSWSEWLREASSLGRTGRCSWTTWHNQCLDASHFHEKHDYARFVEQSYFYSHNRLSVEHKKHEDSSKLIKNWFNSDSRNIISNADELLNQFLNASSSNILYIIYLNIIKWIYKL